MHAPVALQGSIEVGPADERIGGLLNQPVRALEGPAAADSPQRVGRQRRVADERQARARGGTKDVGQLELAQHLGLLGRAVEIGRVGQLVDQAAVGALEIGAELRQPVAVRGHENHGEVVLVGERVRAVGIEQPHPRVRRRRAQPAPVGPVEEAVVRLHASGHARPLRHLRVPAVGRHDQPGAQLPALVRAVLHLDAGGPTIAAQADRGPAGEQLDPRRLGCQLAQDRVERLARDAVAVRRVAVGDDPAAAGRPEVDAVVHRPACLQQRREAELLDRRCRAGLEVMRADGLVRVDRGAALDQRHARATLRVQPRRGATRGAGADDGDVVVGDGRRHPRRSRACRRWRPTIPRSPRLPGGGTMPSCRATSFMS